MRFLYSAEHVDFLRQGYQQMKIPELTVAFNLRFGLSKTETAIKTALSNRQITCGRTPGFPKGTFLAYSPEQANYLSEHYKHLTIADLTAAFNQKFGTSKPSSSIRALTKNHQIKSGRTGQFAKGEKPWNTNTKGLTVANSGSFKSGAIPRNLKPLGHERICTKDGYVLVKIAERNPYTGADTRYKAKHIVVWEAEHGQIPQHHVIAFLDNDKTNCAIDNLSCISRQESLYLNRHKLHSLPAEIMPSAVALAKLETSRFKLKKTNKNSPEAV